jgi:hypothetical protein
MRKFILMALAGTAIALAAPEFASATPMVSGGLATAADSVAVAQEVHHRSWHRRHRHCVHRRHWSGHRCW